MHTNITKEYKYYTSRQVWHIMDSVCLYISLIDKDLLIEAHIPSNMDSFARKCHPQTTV